VLRLPASPSRISHHIQNIGPAFALAVATLWLLQISLLSALITTLALAVIMQTGRALAAKSGLGDVGLGVGFVVGVGVFVFSGQALLIAGIPAYVAHWSVLVAMLAVAAMISRRKTADDSTGDPSVGGEALFALSIALIVLSMRHPWVFPFAIPLAIFERYRHHTQHQVVLRLVTVTLIPVGWLVASVLRPDRWWYFYQNGDASFFESVSWTTSHWSIFEQPGNVGGSMAGYHWLSYTFFGGVSNIAQLAPFEALMKLGIPLVSVVLVSLLCSQILTQSPQFNNQTWATICVVIIGLSWLRIDSASFGMMSALSFIVLAYRYFKFSRSRIAPFLLLTLSSLTVIFSKAPTVLMLLGLFTIHFVTEHFFRDRRNYIVLGSLIAASFVSFLLVFRGSRAGDSIFLLDFSPLRVLDQVLSFPITSLLIPLALLACFGVSSDLSMQDEELKRLLKYVLVCLFGVMLPALFLGHSHFFVQPPIFIASSIATWIFINRYCQNLDTSFRKLKMLWQQTFALTMILCLSLAYRVLINRINARVELRDTLGEVFWGLLLNSAPFLLIGVTLTTVILTHRSRITQRLASGVMAICLAVTVGLSLDYSRRIATWGPSVYTNWPQNSSPFGVNDLIAVASFIRIETQTNNIFATNNFCCFGQVWWKEIVTSLNQDDDSSRTWKDADSSVLAWGGDNYLASAYTRRRFLMEGLAFQVGHVQGPTKEQIQRMTLSLKFANSPNRQAASDLKAYGVSGYVVNLSLTEHRDWSEFAIERFQSGNFVYLELK